MPAKNCVKSASCTYFQQEDKTFKSTERRNMQLVYQNEKIRITISEFLSEIYKKGRNEIISSSVEVFMSSNFESNVYKYKLILEIKTRIGNYL